MSLKCKARAQARVKAEFTIGLLGRTINYGDKTGKSYCYSPEMEERFEMIAYEICHLIETMPITLLEQDEVLIDRDLHEFVKAAAGPLADVSLTYDEAAEMMTEINVHGMQHIFAEALYTLAERAVAQDNMAKVRSEKGARSQRDAASKRKDEVYAVALEIISARSRQVESYAQLAGLVAPKIRHLGISVETVRKYLLESKILA